MRTLLSFGMWLALTISAISTAWADCRFNEAESLNAKITSRVIIARSLNGWTAEMEERLEEIKNQFNKASDQHSVAETTDDLTALSPVCDDYRALLVEIDELTKQLE